MKKMIRLLSVLLLSALFLPAVLVGCGEKEEVPSGDGTMTRTEGFYEKRDAVDYSKKITGTAYYVSSSTGDDANDGLTENTAFKTLARASEVVLEAGDGILLKCGDVWTGETFMPQGSGTFEEPVVIYSYGTGNRPVIKNAGMDKSCVVLEGNQGIIVAGLELAESYGGLLIQYQGENSLGNDYLHLENLYVRDMIDAFNSDPYEYNHTSFGIALRGNVDWNADTRLMLTNFVMRDIEFYNCEVGFWGSGKIGFKFVDNFDYGIVDGFLIENIRAKLCGKWAYSFHFMENGVMKNVDSYYSGQNANNFGSCSYLIIAMKNVLVKNIFIDGHYRNAAQNYDGAGFDFEGLCENVTLCDSYIKNIDGPGIMIFNNGGGRDNMDILIDNVTIENYGLNDGVRASAEGAGIQFIGNSNGKISNCKLINVRSQEKTPAYREVNGTKERFVFENNEIITNDLAWSYDFEGGLGHTMGFAGVDFTYDGVTKHVGSTLDRVSARDGYLIAEFGNAEQYLMSPDNIRCELNAVSTLELKLKNNTSATKLRFEYTYEANPRDMSFEIDITPNDTEFKTYTIDLKQAMGANKRGDMKWFKIYLVDGTGEVLFDSFKIF